MRTTTRWAALAMCAAAVSAGIGPAGAQQADPALDGAPALVRPGPAASRAQKARYRANRARRRTIREARSFAGASSAAASSIAEGSSSVKPSLDVPGGLIMN